jgi:SPP1 gp7 family putative phage head morphogenesis protein
MRKPDPAHLATDDLIAKIEKEITKEYKQAHKEVASKMDDYLKRFATKDKTWQKWVESGKKTKDEYKKWKTGQILMGKRWGDLKETLSQDYTNAAKISQSIANGYRAEAYAINHNYTTYEIEKASRLNTSYSLYSRESVERMYRNNPKLYHDPGKKISQAIREGKQMDWNRRRIQSVITQGILQGESVPDLTKRLERVTGGDHAAAIRNARTMITGAQNAGRIDAMDRAKGMGIPVKKQWLATLDDRTRHEHRELDGMIVETDEPFEVGDYKIMFPGDPDAEPEMAYNCRCTLLTVIPKHEIDTSDTELRHDDHLGGMSYDEWKESKDIKSNPITLPEEKALAIKASYVRKYREK